MRAGPMGRNEVMIYLIGRDTTNQRPKRVIRA